MLKRLIISVLVWVILVGFQTLAATVDTVYTSSDGLQFNSVRTLFIDSKGNKWMGGKDGGVSK